MRASRLAWALLALGWLTLLVGQLADTLRGSPEPAVRRYLADLESHQIERALAALTPEAAARWRDFVEFQQYNRYQVIGVAVRSPSLLASFLQGVPWRADQVTLVVDVTEPSGIRWRASTIVPVRYEQGRWLIERPPLASD